MRTHGEGKNNQETGWTWRQGVKTGLRSLGQAQRKRITREATDGHGGRRLRHGWMRIQKRGWIDKYTQMRKRVKGRIPNRYYQRLQRLERRITREERGD